MTDHPQNHLSAEALDDVLIGMASAEAEQHLAACAQCRAQVKSFYTDLQLLDESSLAWSRVRAAGMSDVTVNAAPRRCALATMGWMTAGVVLLALALPVWRHLGRSNDALANQPAPPVAVVADDSAAQIAADNKLLEEIDAAVNHNEASPFGEELRTDRPYARQKARPE